MSTLAFLRKESNSNKSELNSKLLNELTLTKQELKVPAHVNYHTSDLKMDMEILLDEEHECDSFIWVIRTSGTNLYSEKNLFSKTSHEHSMFNYYKNYDKSIYRINVTERDTLNKKVYGTIEKISNVRDFTTKVLTKSEENEKVVCKVITKENDKILGIIHSEENFCTSKFFKEKLNYNYDNIKKVYYLRYYS